MEDTKEILTQALSLIKPTKKEEEEVREKVDDILSKINKNLKNARAILGGSGEKGTWLKEAHDADIFVLFDYKKYENKSDKLADMLRKHLKKMFPDIIQLHGSRDYFQIKRKDFTFEIVPILGIKKAEQAKNITDVSPLHAKWVLKYKKLADEIRLVKQFCKAANVYGAESYIKGFSGYICEILAIYYGGFLNLARNAARWKDKVVIDSANYYKGKKVMDEMNKSKTYSPLVIIDPVQADRNAAAALSKEKFDMFREACRKFLKHPSKEFFERKEISKEGLDKKARGKGLILLDAKAKAGKVDVIGSMLLKTLEHFNKKLLENDFKVYEHGWQWDKKSNVSFYFIVDNKTLPATKKHIGPPLKADYHAKQFKKKYKRTFTENGRVCTLVKRAFRKPEGLIRKSLEDEYVMERVKSIRVGII